MPPALGRTPCGAVHYAAVADAATAPVVMDTGKSAVAFEAQRMQCHVTLRCSPAEHRDNSKQSSSSSSSSSSYCGRTENNAGVVAAADRQNCPIQRKRRIIHEHLRLQLNARINRRRLYTGQSVTCDSSFDKRNIYVRPATCGVEIFFSFCIA